ncbi:TonB-dependent receptor plug domain-containing protein [Olleya aquimaris]|uniref:Outer membrane receptor for ferrienterochelin and colicin n=1 Tax=Olleya aquimaris TaxID=639310 RepID=A0A327R734_9FLAO|nr:TonB-dependent receptor [Olleya aquimaris]RAJ11772.1 outer membrane receptor for ferrienterochelin and colicin [Olleya aquimaris]
MSKSLKITLFLIVFLSCFTTYAQNKTLPLLDALSVIEQQFKVSFSYADQTIKGVMVELDTKEDLDTILTKFETQTTLKFNKLDSHFITVTSVTTSFSVQKLDEVIVSNYLTTGISKNKSGNITIKPKLFGILPGLIEPDVLQTIQALPGVLSVDETVSNINVRGGTHDQNLILYDGIKMYQSGHFFGLISAFNPYLTKNVDIIKNGTSAKYGDGVSSVVDMQLSNDTNEAFSAGLGLNMITADGFAVIPLAKHTQLQLATRRSITDVLNTPTYNQYYNRVFQDSDVTDNQESTSNNQTFRFSDISLKLLHDIGQKDKLRFTLLNVFNQLDFDKNNTQDSQNKTNQLKQQNRASGLHYQRLWNKKFNTSAQVYYSNYDLKSSKFDIANNQRLIQENRVINNGLKIDADYNLSTALSLFGGIQFDEVGISNLEEVNSPFFKRDIKRVLRTYSAYAETVFNSKNKNTLIKLGVRHNYFRKFNISTTEPRVYVSQRFLDHFRAEFSAEYKSQSTSQLIDLQNDFLGVETRRWVLANNNTIPIIKSKQASLGLSYNKNKLLISAEAYVKQVDGIISRSQGFQNQYQYLNAIGSYNIKGIDVLFNKQLDAFSSWLSYSYSSNNYTFNTLNNGNPFPNNFDVQHQINYGSTYQWKQLKLALGINWHSGKPFTKPDNNNPTTGNTINYQAPNSSRLADYLRTDVSATYQFKLGNYKAVVGASIWNILDQKNSLNTYYFNNNGQVNKVENVSLGLTPNVSFRVKF